MRRARRHRDPEARLHRGLVEAREEAPRVGGLELRERVALALVARGVEAAQVVAQLARERELYLDLAGSYRSREAERDRLTLGTRLDARAEQALVGRDARAGDAQLGGVQLDRAHRRAELHRDLQFAAVLGSALGIDVEVQVVVARDDVAGEAMACAAPRAGRSAVGQGNPLVSGVGA